LSKKRITILILWIIGISSVLLTYACYSCETLVLEEWGGSVISPRGAISFNAPNLVGGDLLQVSYRTEGYVKVFVFPLEYWEMHKEDFSEELSLPKVSQYRRNYEYFECQIVKDGSYIIVGRNYYSDTSGELRLRYEVIRYPYRPYWLPVLTPGVAAFVASIPILLLHKEPPFSCPWCGEKQDFGWDPKTKKRYCRKCGWTDLF